MWMASLMHALVAAIAVGISTLFDFLDKRMEGFDFGILAALLLLLIVLAVSTASMISARSMSTAASSACVNSVSMARASTLHARTDTR